MNWLQRQWDKISSAGWDNLAVGGTAGLGAAYLGWKYGSRAGGGGFMGVVTGLLVGTVSGVLGALGGSALYERFFPGESRDESETERDGSAAETETEGAEGRREEPEEERETTRSTTSERTPKRPSSPAAGETSGAEDDTGAEHNGSAVAEAATDAARPAVEKGAAHASSAYGHVRRQFNLTRVVLNENAEVFCPAGRTSGAGCTIVRAERSMA